VPYHIGNGWGGDCAFITGRVHDRQPRTRCSIDHRARGVLRDRVIVMPETRKISIWNPEEAKWRRSARAARFLRAAGQPAAFPLVIDEGHAKTARPAGPLLARSLRRVSLAA